VAPMDQSGPGTHLTARIALYHRHRVSDDDHRYPWHVGRSAARTCPTASN
jgi:hypothetical protein